MPNQEGLNVTNDTLKTAIIPYLGAIAVFVSLIINNYISSRFRKRDVQRNWYLKVLIEPNIKNIDKFYEDISLRFNESITSLDKNKNVPLKKILKLKVFEIGAFQELKRKFENSFIRLIALSYKKYPRSFFEELIKAIFDENTVEENSIPEELTNVILDLEDFYTQNLDNYHSKSESIEEFEKFLTFNKANLLSILFKPLR